MGDYKNSAEWKKEAQYRAAIAGYETANATDIFDVQTSPSITSPSNNTAQPALPTEDSVDYDNLVRNPEKYAGKTVEFSGEAFLDGADSIFQIIVDNDLGKRLWISTDRCDLPQRVLDGDNIKVTGIVDEQLLLNHVVIQATNVEWY